MLEWRPDTCGCVLGYAPRTGNQREHFRSAVRICPQHEGLRGVSVHDAVLAECQMKNRVLDAIARTASNLSVRVRDSRGHETEEVLIREDVVDWYFDQDRKLIVTLLEEPRDVTRVELEAALVSFGGVELR